MNQQNIAKQRKSTVKQNKNRCPCRRGGRRVKRERMVMLTGTRVGLRWHSMVKEALALWIPPPKKVAKGGFPSSRRFFFLSFFFSFSFSFLLFSFSFFSGLACAIRYCRVRRGCTERFALRNQIYSGVGFVTSFFILSFLTLRKSTIGMLGSVLYMLCIELDSIRRDTRLAGEWLSLFLCHVMTQGQRAGRIYSCL
ncbi:hypothetical protein HOY80DRAFT_67583 [Tuber brumale]|nr:hypothetical protein HOY80DRAFT_67583 [Tuber brumale]